MQELEEFRAIAGYGAGGHDELRACDEWEVDLKGGDVEGDGGDGDEDIFGGEAGLFGHGEKQVDDVGLRDLDAFGAAGRAGGIDDVGDSGGIVGEVEGAAIADFDDGPALVYTQNAGICGWEIGGESGLGKDCRLLKIFEDHLQAFHGEGGIERDVGGAGLPGGEERDDEVDRPLHVDANDLAGKDAGGGEVAGELVGAGVELGVGELFAFALESNR